jgi:aminopeptidase N/puromycin-sensitive aminopeptidase
VRVGREPVGDYLALAQGLGSDRTRAVLQEVLDHLGYIGTNLVSDSDSDAYRAWLRQYLTPILNDVGWEPKPGDADEQKALRARLIVALAHDARDPAAIAEARKIADKALENPASVERDLAEAALRAAAMNGDASYYDKVMAKLKDAKSPEEYYMYLFTLAQVSDPALLQRTLELAVSPDVRSQDALQLIGSVMRNPAGQKLAWDFVLAHWDSVQKAGGPFASADIVAATGSFCDAQARDQVEQFFAAHKIEAAERTYRQSMERISDCIALKSEQQPQLASWLGKQGTMAGGK